MYGVVFLAALAVDIIPLIRRATRVDDRGISISQIPSQPVDRFAALCFRFNPWEDT